MHDAIERGAIASAAVAVAEDATAQGGAVERSAVAVGAGFGEGVRGGEEEVGGRRGEVGEDASVGARAGFDDLAGEDVGVDDGEGVGGLAEEVGNGGFAGGDGAGEAEEEHAWLWGCGRCLCGRVGCGGFEVRGGCERTTGRVNDCGLDLQRRCEDVRMFAFNC